MVVVSCVNLTVNRQSAAFSCFHLVFEETV